MKKRELSKKLAKFFSVLGLVVAFLIFISIGNQGIGFKYISMLIVLVLVSGAIIKWKKQIVDFGNKHLKLVAFSMVILTIVGFGARFAFVFAQDNFAISSALSDTGVHWYGAQQLVDKGELDQEVGDYENVYPYLSTYTGTLAVAMKIFGESYSAVVFSNIFFDLISCVCLYILFALWKGGWRVGLSAATIWAINPLQIIFCSMPLAIVTVNMFVLLSILGVFLVLKYRNNWGRLCLFSVITGSTLAVGNAYRPIFVVFLLAFLVYWLVLILRDKKELRLAVASCLLVGATYLVVGLVPGLAHGQINPYYQHQKSQAGWSFYVGANYETSGRWSGADRDVFFGPVLIDQAKGDVVEANKIIFLKGGKRYLDILKDGHIVAHFLNKISVVFGDVKNSVYDLPYVFNFSKSSEKYSLMQDSILLFYCALLFALGYSLYKRIKSRRWLEENNFLLFLTILFSGLFIASLLVEVMNRYSLPFIAILVIIVLGMATKARDRNKKSVI